MRKTVAATALVLVAGSAPAWATGTIACSAPDDAVTVELVVGSLDVLSVQRAEIVRDGRAISTEAEEADAMRVGQQFRSADTLLVDFTDTNVQGVVAELRLFEASELRDRALAGTLRIAGQGAWPIICQGP